MNIEHIFQNILSEGEVIAYFGKARLVKRLDCKFELRGGSPEDLSAAKEWISLFMHEAVLVVPSEGRLRKLAPREDSARAVFAGATEQNADA